MPSPSEADREHLQRVLEGAKHHLKEVGDHVHKAQAYIKEAFVKLAGDDYDAAVAFYELMSEKALRAIGLMTHAKIPGVDPGQLAARDNPKIVRGRDWLREKDLTTLKLTPRAEFLAKQQEMARGRDELSEMGLLFGEDSKKLSSVDILGSMAKNGWDSERIGEWYTKLMEATETKGTINQKVEVGRLVARVIQHTEPRQLFEITDADIEGMTDDELDTITEEAAQFVHSRLKQARGKLES